MVVGGLLRGRTERLVLGALIVGALLAGFLAPEGSVPIPLYFIGLVGGATIALHAIGIVLVYRANRIINFAQIQMGVTAGLVFVQLVSHRVFIRAVSALCPPCLPEPGTLGEYVAQGGRSQIGELLRDKVFASSFGPETSLQDPTLLRYFPDGFSATDFAISIAPRWLVHLNYWLSLLIAVTVAVLLLWALYALVIRRFANAPKLVLTVITIAAGFFMQTLGVWVAGLFGSGDAASTVAPSARLPFTARFTWSPVVFSAADVLTVVVVIGVAAGLGLYLFRSRIGVVLRGASENPARAETLGVNVASVTARAWIIAGALSGIAAVLAVARSGSAPAGANYEIYIRTLGAAVSGALVSLPLAAIVGLLIGVIDQVFSWIFGTQSLLAVLLLGIILTFLLVQRARATRAERESQATWRASRELRAIPAQLRTMPSVRAAIRMLTTVLVIVAVGYPWFMSPSQTNIGVVTMIQAMLGLSLLVLTGWAGQVSLGQMAFAAFGAWTAARLGLPFPFSVLAGALAGMVLAFVVGIPSLKLRGLHLAISTLALGVAAPAILFDDHALGRGLSRALARPVIAGVDFESERAFYYLVLAFLVATVAAVLGIRRSAIGRSLIAMKDNEYGAMSFGIGLLRARTTAFAISGTIAAAAGVLLAYAQHGVDPLAFQPESGVAIFLMTLIGGLGSVAGPLIGALYLGLLRIFSGTSLQQFATVLLNPGVGVILVLLLLPGGVTQGLHAIRDAWLRRLASRHGIDVPTLATDRGATGAPLPIQPKVRPTGGEMFVPKRFRLSDQWLIEARRRDSSREGARG